MPGASATITRGRPRMAFTSDDLPTLGRPRMATRISSAVLQDPLGADLVQPVDHLVEQITGAAAVQRRHGYRVAETEGVQLERRLLVSLSRRPCSPRRSTGRPDRRRIWAISSSPAARPARASITRSTRSASSTACRACSATCGLHRRDVAGIDAAGVDQDERVPAPLAHDLVAVAGDPRRLVDDGRRLAVSRLISVDLPAFGKPTTADHVEQRSGGGVSVSSVLTGPSRAVGGSRPSAHRPSPGRPRRGRRSPTLVAARRAEGDVRPSARAPAAGAADRHRHHRSTSSTTAQRPAPALALVHLGLPSGPAMKMATNHVAARRCRGRCAALRGRPHRGAPETPRPAR